MMVPFVGGFLIDVCRNLNANSHCLVAISSTISSLGPDPNFQIRGGGSVWDALCVFDVMDWTAKVIYWTSWSGLVKSYW